MFITWRPTSAEFCIRLSRFHLSSLHWVVSLVIMGEEKGKLDLLRAKRGGHRTVVTKNINEARTILEHTDLELIMWSRLNVLEQILDEKLISLAGFDKEITKICSVDHIEEEIEVADEIRSRILQTKAKIAIARARVKNGRTSSSILRLHMVRHKIIIRRNIQPPITKIKLLQDNQLASSENSGQICQGESGSSPSTAFHTNFHNKSRWRTSIIEFCKWTSSNSASSVKS